MWCLLRGKFGRFGNAESTDYCCRIPASLPFLRSAVQRRRAAGVPTADWLMAPASAAEVEGMLGWPVVVKPNRQGSTIGLSVVRAPDEREPSLIKAACHDREVIIEQFIPGREFTVGILDGKALPVGEILLDSAVFDNGAKYRPGGVREIFPAAISQEQGQQLQEFALRAHRALELGSYGRIDFRLDSAGRPFCLEANSLPGMTATSLLPQAALAEGIAFPALLERICKGRSWLLAKILPPDVSGGKAGTLGASVALVRPAFLHSLGRVQTAGIRCTRCIDLGIVETEADLDGPCLSRNADALRILIDR
jgi:hypothetical protein